MHVASWRCFIAPIKVGPFGKDLNVLYAPNSTGKSTLFEALLRGILDGHRVSGKEIQAIRPWGRSLSPTVTVEFAHNGIDYRITKQFLDNASSRLERKEAGRFVSLAESKDADETVRAILSQNTPGRGLAQSKDWGLAQVLWAPQGDLTIGQLSGDVLADIRASLGVQVAGPEVSPIEKRIQETWLQFFTPGGNLKTGKEAPDIVRLRERLRKAEDELTSARSQQQDFDETARRVEELRARHADARVDTGKIGVALKEASYRADSYKALLSEKKQREERLNAAEAKHSELKQKMEAIEAARKELGDARETLGKLELDIPLQQQEVESRTREVAESKAVLDDVRKRRQAIDAAQETAEQARRFIENNKTLADLNGRIEKITTARKTLAERERERADLVAPDARVLWAIGRALKDIDEAQVRIDASLITLEITPEQDGSIEVLSGDETGTRTLHQGSPLQIKGSPGVMANLPGIARLRAWGPAGSIDLYRDDKAAAERRLEELTQPFGTINLEELKELNRMAEEVDKRLAEAKTRLGTLLSSRSLEDIEQERSQVEAVVAKILERYPDWKDTPPDAEALKIAAQESKSAFVREIETAEPRWEAAQVALNKATEQGATLSTQLEGTKTQIESAESRLARLTLDGKSEEEREKEVKGAALALLWWRSWKSGLKLLTE
jgi:DNA repair exonuclease SbcCD ATPase subunit